MGSTVGIIEWDDDSDPNRTAAYLQCVGDIAKLYDLRLDRIETKNNRSALHYVLPWKALLRRREKKETIRNFLQESKLTLLEMKATNINIYLVHYPL